MPFGRPYVQYTSFDEGSRWLSPPQIF